MAVYSITNQGVVNAGPGVDRLVVNYDFAAVFPPPAAPGPMTATLTGGSFATGYAGVFDGSIDLDIVFSGIEHFTFIDVTGQADVIYTGDGNDLMRAGGGDDFLFTGGGQDRVLGGVGNDRWQADLSSFNRGVQIDLNADVSTFLDRGEVRGVEGLYGFGADYVPVFFRATEGRDEITLHKTSFLTDWVDLGGGNDRLTTWFGSENDVFRGGEGSDMLTVINSVWNQGLTLSEFRADPAGGWAGVFHEGPFPTQFGRKLSFEGFERFRYIDLAGSGDYINLGSGNDVINAGAGVDIIGGGAGADTLTGGLGDDYLSGGADADVFVYGRRAFEGRDTISDFDDGVDLIAIAGGRLGGLTIESANGGADTLITTAGGTEILLTGVASDLFGAADFLFT